MFQKKLLSCFLPSFPVARTPVVTMRRPIQFYAEVGNVVVVSDGVDIQTKGAKLDFAKRLNYKPLGIASVRDGVILISSEGATRYLLQENGLRYKGDLGVVSNPTAIAAHGDLFCLGSRGEAIFYRLNGCSAIEIQRIPVALGEIRFLAMPNEKTVVGIVHKDEGSYELFVSSDVGVQATALELGLEDHPRYLSVSIEKNQIVIGVHQKDLVYTLNNLESPPALSPDFRGISINNACYTQRGNQLFRLS